jgi:hypothetical protein
MAGPCADAEPGQFLRERDNVHGELVWLGFHGLSFGRVTEGGYENAAYHVDAIWDGTAIVV